MTPTQICRGDLVRYIDPIYGPCTGTVFGLIGANAIVKCNHELPGIVTSVPIAALAWISPSMTKQAQYFTPARTWHIERRLNDAWSLRNGPYNSFSAAWAVISLLFQHHLADFAEIRIVTTFH
jgi:hypothetical protein